MSKRVLKIPTIISLSERNSWSPGHGSGPIHSDRRRAGAMKVREGSLTPARLAVAWRRVGWRSVVAGGGAIALVASGMVAPARATDGINCYDQNPYPDGTPRLAFTRPLPIPTVLADANITIPMKNAP